MRYRVMQISAGYLVHHTTAAPVVVRIVLEHDVTDVEDGGNGGVHLYSIVMVVYTGTALFSREERAVH